MGRLGWATILGCLLGMFLVGLMLRGCNAGAEGRVAVRTSALDSQQTEVAPSPAPSLTGEAARKSAPSRAPAKKVGPRDRMYDEHRKQVKAFEAKPAVTTTGAPTSALARTARDAAANTVFPRANTRRVGGPAGGVSVISAPQGAPAPQGPGIFAPNAADNGFIQQELAIPDLGQPAPRPSNATQPADASAASESSTSPGTSPTGSTSNPGGGFTTVTGLPQSGNPGGGGNTGGGNTGGGNTGGGNTGGGNTTTLGAFALLLPANSAGSISPQAQFRWNTSDGATSYRLRVSTLATLSTLVVDQSGISGTTFTVPSGALLPNTTYFWTVNSVNTAGNRPATATFSFTTGQSAPGAFALASPANNARSISGAVSLSWNASAGAATYAVTLSTNQDLSSPVLSQSGVTGTSLSVDAESLQPGVDYYWRVVATNAGGATTATPSPSKFTTLGAPGLFTLVSPSNNATGLIRPLPLAWTPSLDAATYRLEVAADSAFTQVVVNRAGLTAPSTLLMPADIEAGRTYFWRVTAVNPVDVRASSETFSFSTKAAPAPFALVSPGNNLSIGLPVTLDWDDSTGALLYSVQVSESETFATTVLDEFVVPLISGSSFAVPDGVLQIDRSYFWRVIAQNEAGETLPAGAPFKFTIGVADYDVNRNGVVEVLDIYAWRTLPVLTDLNGDGQISDADRIGLRSAVRTGEASDIAVRN